MFAYCDNNPIIRTDQSGQLWDIIFDVGSFISSIYDVCTNPSDPWAWAGLAGDAVDLIPFVTGVGETVKVVSAANKAVDAIDTVHDVAKTTDNISDSARAVTKSANNIADGASKSKSLHRPYIRKSTRMEVEAMAPKTPDGRFIDIHSGKPIDGKYDLGHVYGKEYWRMRDWAMEQGMTQKQFNNYMNNPRFYQIEDPRLNRSHRYEMR